MAIFQIGGLGVMMISTFFYLILKRRIGLKQRQLIMTDTNQFTMSGMVRMLREILVLIFGIELIGALILGFTLFLCIRIFGMLCSKDYIILFHS